MKKYKNRIIIGIFIIAALTIAFFVGGDKPSLNRQSDGTNIQSVQPKDANDNKTDEKTENSQDEKEQNEYPKDEGSLSDDTNSHNESNVSEMPKEQNHETNGFENRTTETPEQKHRDVEYSKEHGMNIDDKTGEDEYKTEPVPQGKPVPVEPQDSKISDTEMTCILSVRCDTILNNLSKFNPDKTDILPRDGIIFAEREVTFYEGESVFNVTLREMKKNKIHMEFVNTPIYNSAYIEGIGNIYEYDCGELSGWLYSVNGWFPNYGCSRYALKQGDKIEWQYTCDLGADVGEHSLSDGGQRDE